MFQAFFTAPDILDDPINSLKIKDFTTEFNSKLDQNQVYYFLYCLIENLNYIVSQKMYY